MCSDIRDVFRNSISFAFPQPERERERAVWCTKKCGRNCKISYSRCSMKFDIFFFVSPAARTLTCQPALRAAVITTATRKVPISTTDRIDIVTPSSQKIAGSRVGSRSKHLEKIEICRGDKGRSQMKWFSRLLTRGHF